MEKRSEESRRFLHKLGKRLLPDEGSGARWSLRESRQDERVFNEIGVSLLECPGSNVNNDDIENHSPNSPRGQKRSFSQSGPTDRKVLSPLKNTNNSAAGSSNVNRSHSVNLAFNHSEEALNEVDLETINNKTQKSGLALMSPMTTCSPCPPLHEYRKMIKRHSTFENEDVSFGDDHDKTQATESNSEYLGFNLCLNQEIIDVGVSIKNNSETNNSDNDESVNEKGCFTIERSSSVCNCDKKNTPESEPVVFNNTEGEFSKLLDEIVVYIFQYLPKKMLVRCMSVCKRWNRLALNSGLWARVCLGGRSLNSGVLPALMKRHPVVLRLANSQLLPPVVPKNLSFPEWKVQYLDLSAATITPECLGEILSRCPALLRLSLEGLTMCESASRALGTLTNLRVLNLALVTDLGEVGATSLTYLNKLEALNVAWTRLNERATEILCGGLTSTLQRLNLSGFRKTLTEKLIKLVVFRCPNLVELDVSDCVMMGENVIPILMKLKSLEHLAFSRCSRLKKTDIILLGEFPVLQWVDIFGLLYPSSMFTLPNLKKILPKITFNQFVHSSIARPTVGVRRTSIWGLRTRD